MEDRRGAAWMVWLGAFLVLTLIPLDPVHFRLSLRYGWDPGDGKAVVIETPLLTYDWFRPSTFLATAFQAAVLIPSLVATLAPRRFERTVLVAFLPLSAIFSAWASQAPLNFSSLPRNVLNIPSGLSAALPAALAAGVLLAYMTGVPTATLARWARRLLAVDILWIILLQWNALGMSPRYFPGWIGAGGALMILAGELLAARDSRFQIRDTPR